MASNYGGFVTEYQRAGTNPDANDLFYLDLKYDALQSGLTGTLQKNGNRPGGCRNTAPQKIHTRVYATHCARSRCLYGIRRHRRTAAPGRPV